MNILLACQAGVSTSMLAEKMEAYAKENGMEAKVWAVDFGMVEEEIRSSQVDVILIGPQISYKLPTLKKELAKYSIPIAAISFQDYGTMNAGKVFKTAVALKGEE